MKLSEFTESQFLRYFEVRLSDKRMRRSAGGYIALCPFHEDRNPSLSVSTAKGCYMCHSGCGAGGVLDFEMKFSGCDKETALARIGEIVGEKQLQLGQQPEAIYPYTDVFGKLAFQVVRYPGKRFTQRQPDGKNGWIYKTDNLRMMLYNLPKVATCKQSVIVEGEKDCDNLQKALEKFPGVAVTTSPRGAGKWHDYLSPYFTGKQVLILPDNDEPGRKHAEVVAGSVYRYAHAVKIINLPGLPEKGDVSDFLKTSTGEALITLAKGGDWWKPPINESSSLFMTVTEFEKNAPDTIDWVVEGLIQRGANGLMIARPKSGKSFAVLDLAVAIASGQRWLDFYVPKRARVALVSREDYFGLTQARERKIRKHRQLMAEELDGWLYINAKGIRPKLMLDDEAEVATLIADLKKNQTEFLILDVMRVLHGSDENDNTQMQKVIDTLNRIQEACGCSICLIHHDNKREDATLTERARGASAIAGYAEFIIGLRVVDEEEHIREFNCELKAAMAPDKFHFKILDTADDGITLDRVNWVPKTRRGKGKSNDQTEFSGYADDAD
jgi:putative DNA primase/helicase